MFREICLLRAEDLSVELSPGASRLLARLPHPAAAAAARGAATPPGEAEALWPAQHHECHAAPAAEHTWRKEGGRTGSRWKTAASAAQLLTDVGFLVYASVHVAAAVAVARWASWRLVGLCGALYGLRMFGITGGFHRLLSHRSYKTSRAGQLVMATLGCLAFQKGPLWWASHHRHHHRTADTEADAHSPLLWGFWWSHMGWFLCTQEHSEVLWAAVPDLVRFPELQWLERYHYVPPLAVGALLLAVTGLPGAGWGFAVSTVLCWHATYCINSVAHLVGSRRFRCEFNTHCGARNNWWLALATLGEGWHNNHHCYMRSARHGFYAHEIDVTWYILLALEKLGLVWDLERPPLPELEKHRYDDTHLQCRCARVSQDLNITSSAAS